MAKQMTSEQATEVLNKSIVSHPGINLQAGEVCYFASDATALIAKNQVVGSTYNSAGSSLYSSKYGVGFHTRQGVRNNVRGTVVDRYDGHLYLTSRRILMVAYKGGFDIALNQLTALDFYDDGLMVTASGKSYLISCKNINKLKKVIEANNAIQSAGLGTAQPQVQSTETKKRASDSAPYAQDAPSEQSAGVPVINAGSSESGKSKVILWIVFIVVLLLAVIAVTGQHQIRFAVLFGAIAVGAALHLDPLGLRSKGKLLPVAATWMICIVIAIMGAVLIK